MKLDGIERRARPADLRIKTLNAKGYDGCKFARLHKSEIFKGSLDRVDAKKRRINRKKRQQQAEKGRKGRAPGKGCSVLRNASKDDRRATSCGQVRVFQCSSSIVQSSARSSTTKVPVASEIVRPAANVPLGLTSAATSDSENLLPTGSAAAAVEPAATGTGASGSVHNAHVEEVISEIEIEHFDTLPLSGSEIDEEQSEVSETPALIEQSGADFIRDGVCQSLPRRTSTPAGLFDTMMSPSVDFDDVPEQFESGVSSIEHPEGVASPEPCESDVASEPPVTPFPSAKLPFENEDADETPELFEANDDASCIRESPTDSPPLDPIAAVVNEHYDDATSAEILTPVVVFNEDAPANVSTIIEHEPMDFDTPATPGSPSDDTHSNVSVASTALAANESDSDRTSLAADVTTPTDSHGVAIEEEPLDETENMDYSDFPIGEEGDADSNAGYHTAMEVDTSDRTIAFESALDGRLDSGTSTVFPDYTRLRCESLPAYYRLQADHNYYPWHAQRFAAKGRLPVNGGPMRSEADVRRRQVISFYGSEMDDEIRHLEAKAIADRAAVRSRKAQMAIDPADDDDVFTDDPSHGSVIFPNGPQEPESSRPLLLHLGRGFPLRYGCTLDAFCAMFKEEAKREQFKANRSEFWEDYREERKLSYDGYSEEEDQSDEESSSGHHSTSDEQEEESGDEGSSQRSESEQESGGGGSEQEVEDDDSPGEEVEDEVEASEGEDDGDNSGNEEEAEESLDLRDVAREQGEALRQRNDSSDDSSSVSTNDSYVSGY